MHRVLFSLQMFNLTYFAHYTVDTEEVKNSIFFLKSGQNIVNGDKFASIIMCILYIANTFWHGHLPLWQLSHFVC